MGPEVKGKQSMGELFRWLDRTERETPEEVRVRARRTKKKQESEKILEKVKKGAGGRKGSDPKKKPISCPVKVGLQFPIGRIGRYLKKGHHSQRVGTGAQVYLTALLAGVTIAHGGVLPNINPVLLPKKIDKTAKEPKSPSKATKSPRKA
ncbi:hypothetical protein AAG906_015101 [Vitis piasezkii]